MADYKDSFYEVKADQSKNFDELKLSAPTATITNSNSTENFAQLSLKPLERGYGLTIGNALRRVLLASLPGAAITSIKIDGVQHEFSSIKGVVEDVTGIVLNLKSVVLKIDSESMEKDLEIDVEGPKTVTAEDIICDEEVEVVNKDQYICRVNEGKLRIQMTARKGIGYKSADENREEYYSTSPEIIPIDSIYTPVTKVAYHIGKVRYKGNPNYEELVLDVTTNGGVTPEYAVAKAAKILKDQLDSIIILSDKAEKEGSTTGETVDTESNESSTPDRPIEDLDLSVRSYNCLKRFGIFKISELVDKTEEDMMKIRNLGKKSLKEIKDKLQEMGLGFSRH